MAGVTSTPAPNEPGDSMKDPRAIICGVLAALAIICGTILAFPPERDAVLVTALFGLAATFGGYVVGLYSSPHDTP